VIRVGSDLRDARVAAGLSLRIVGAAVGLSGPQVSRIERGLAPSVTVGQLSRIGAVVGLDVRVRAYPGGDPIRDAGQSRVIERLRRRISIRSRMRLEVPLPIPGDLRAWDVTIDRLVDQAGQHRDLRVEVETRITDVQALMRRLTLKMRDAEVEQILLVVADTPSNRRAVMAAWVSLVPHFPVSGRTALAALARGRHPGGSALVFL